MEKEITRKTMAMYTVIKRMLSTVTLNNETVPVIRTPNYIIKDMDNTRKKGLRKRLEYIRKKSKNGNLKVPIVTCKNSSLNHYLGQLYGKFDKLPLASQSWAKIKHWGDYFIIHSYGENPSVLEKKKSFKDLNLHLRVLEAIEELGLKNPTSIQNLAIPQLLIETNTVCCAETGSGKTLAYLAPMLHHLIEDKTRMKDDLPRNTPLGLVIVPGRELGFQIGDVALKMASNCGISVDVLIGGSQTNKFNTGSDLVISTIGMISKYSRTRKYNFNNVQRLVLDECDTLVDDSFSEDLNNILRKINLRDAPQEDYEIEDTNGPDGAQLVLVGATMPRNLEETFSEFIELDSLVWLKTDHLHKIMPHITQVFLRVDPNKKTETLIPLLKEELAQKEKDEDKSGIMVFTNNGKACHFLSKLLEENGIKNVPLQGESSFHERQKNFEAFQKGEVDILVCTDLGSRGLDTTRVSHVINFEFPSQVSDYIHRAGRTGRVGSSGGRCTNFIATKYEIPLAQQIEFAARLPKTKALPHVDANIKRKIDTHQELKSKRLSAKKAGKY